MPWDKDTPLRSLSSKGLASEMISAVFVGDYTRADAVVEKYKKKYVNDPYARELLDEVSRSSSLMSFRSLTPCRVDFQTQINARIRAWFKHMPLDIQLGMAQMELFGRHFQHAPVEAFSWSQWHELLDAPDPEQHLLTSALFPIESDQATKKNLASVKRRVGEGIKSLALECLNNGSYEMLDQIMTHGRISAWESCNSFYLHHQSANSSGWTFAELVKPVPFWALGVFHASGTDDYWDVIRKHGGPTTPFVPGRSTTRPTSGQKKCWGDGKSVRAPKDWTNPLGWIRPAQTISRVLSDPGSAQYIASTVEANLASWRQMSLLYHSKSLDQFPSVVSKPSM